VRKSHDSTLAALCGGWSCAASIANSIPDASTRCTDDHRIRQVSRHKPAFHAELRQAVATGTARVEFACGIIGECLGQQAREQTSTNAMVTAGRAARAPDESSSARWTTAGWSVFSCRLTPRFLPLSSIAVDICSILNRPPAWILPPMRRLSTWTVKSGRGMTLKFARYEAPTADGGHNR